MTQLSLPGDPLVQNAVDWGKQNIADLTQTAHGPADPLDQPGQAVPGAARAPSPRRPGSAPATPTTRGSSAPTREYTAFAAVSVGQFEAIKDHLRALRDVSDILNNRSGVVTSTRSVSDGSIWFGHDSQTTNPDGTTTYDFNTDETVKFPSTVALIWRWTGDNALPRRDVRLHRAQPAATSIEQPRRRPRRLARGLGNVERTGMGPEKLDNTVYYIRGLYDLADMARSKHDSATVRVGHEPRRASSQQQLRRHVVVPGRRSSTPTR